HRLVRRGYCRDGVLPRGPPRVRLRFDSLQHARAGSDPDGSSLLDRLGKLVKLRKKAVTRVHRLRPCPGYRLAYVGNRKVALERGGLAHPSRFVCELCVASHRVRVRLSRYSVTPRPPT